MSIEKVRVNKQGRDQLIRLKSKTGIENWHPLCRWAFCVSINESSRPRPPQAGDRPIEMDWKTFGGEYAEVYLALIKQRCYEDGFGVDEQTLSDQLHAHIHRGISYLAGDPNMKNIESLVSKALIHY